MAKTKDRLTDTAGNVRPYVERAMKDEDLRDNLRSAFEAARNVYDELVGGRGVVTAASRVATDKDIQENLKSAVDDLRKASDRLQGKSTHTARNMTLLIAGIALGILFNPMTGPTTRQWIKDKVLGPSDDFTYGGTGGGDSSSGAPTSAPSSTASSS